MTTRFLKEKQRQERESLILKAAEEVLLEKGYHEMSMDEIASRVGIAKGTVYLHFPSKEDLLVAISERVMKQFLQCVEEAVASETTTQAKMQAILNIMFTGFFSKNAQLLFSIKNNADLRRFFAEKNNCMRDLWYDFTRRMSVLIEEGKAAGEFDASVPTEAMLSAFLSLISPKSYERLMLEQQMPAGELVQYLGHIYFNGITAK